MAALNHTHTMITTGTHTHALPNHNHQIYTHTHTAYPYTTHIQRTPPHRPGIYTENITTTIDSEAFKRMLEQFKALQESVKKVNENLEAAKYPNRDALIEEYEID